MATPKTGSLKKTLLLLGIVVFVFLGAAMVFYLFMIRFPFTTKIDENYLPITTIEFTNDMYPQLLDLGKFFLTLLIGVFVASITFSEKIVNISASTWWSKSLLIFCWVLLLLSIVADGVGLVFLTNWFANEKIVHSAHHMPMFANAFICFAMAGICFGLALCSMLCAGIISFVHTQAKTPLAGADTQGVKAVKKTKKSLHKSK